MIAPKLKQLDPGRQIEMHCFDFKSTENQNVPKYTLHVVDAQEQSLIAKNTCAALITPQGRERESAFATERGRYSLCAQAQASRIIIILLGHGHTFGSLADIQDELTSKILELSPDNCANYDSMPVMTAGSDIGEKALVDLRDADQVKGVIIQDVRPPDVQQGVVLRQVIYEDKVD